MPIETRAPSPVRPVSLPATSEGTSQAPTPEQAPDTAAHDWPQAGPSALSAEAQHQASLVQQRLLQGMQRQDSAHAMPGPSASQPGGKREVQTDDEASLPKRAAAGAGTPGRPAIPSQHSLLAKYLADEQRLLQGMQRQTSAHAMPGPSASQPGGKRAAQTPDDASPPKRAAAGSGTPDGPAILGQHALLAKYLADDECRRRFEAFQSGFNHHLLPDEEEGTIQSVAEPVIEHPERYLSIFTNCFGADRWIVQVNNFSRHESLTLADVLLGQSHWVAQEQNRSNDLPASIVVKMVLCQKTHVHCEKAVRQGKPIDLGQMRSPLGRSLADLLNLLGVQASSVKWNGETSSLTLNLRP